MIQPINQYEELPSFNLLLRLGCGHSVKVNVRTLAEQPRRHEWDCELCDRPTRERRINRIRWRDPEHREVILNLECGHNIHTSKIQMELMTRKEDHWICPHCPEPTLRVFEPVPMPEAIARHFKTPRQLWKEAGEP